MILKLCTYNNVKNKINKDNNVVVLTTSRYFNFKQPYDVMNPTIILEEPKNHLSYNYVIIEDEEETFKKCYFVIDRIIRNNNMIELNLREDTLYTFKSAISSNNLFIERSSSLYDITLYDSLLPRKNKQDKIDISDLIDLTDSDINIDIDNNVGPYDDWAYSLSSFVYNKDINTIGTYTTNINNLSILPTQISSPYIFNIKNYVVNSSYIEDLSNKIRDNDALNSFIISCIKYPFILKRLKNKDGLLVETDYYIGSEKIWNIGSYVSTNRLERYHFFNIDFTSYNFDDTTLYNDNDSKLLLTIPFYKDVELNFDLIRNKKLSIDFFVDIPTGQCNVVISTIETNLNDNIAIYSDIFQLGQQLAFNTTNTRENNNTTISNTLNATIGTIGSATSIAFGLASGNPIAVVGGTLSLAKTITGATTTALNIINRANTKNIGGSFNYISNTLTPRLILLKRGYANHIEFKSINGRLYNNYHIINNDLGFFKIGQNQHLTTSSDMTLQEEQDIINQLENGVYY